MEKTAFKDFGSMVFTNEVMKEYLPKDVYNRYCQFWNIELDESGKPIDPEKLTQAKFTRYLKRDYNEFKVKQVRVNGQPTQVVMDVIVKDWNEVPEQNLTTVETKKEETKTPAKPVQQPQMNFDSYSEEENPFADIKPDDDYEIY